jgi:hypothetical protein
MKYAQYLARIKDYMNTSVRGMLRKIPVWIRPHAA